jgi:hypothetical protein
MYALHARELRTARTLRRKIKVIDDLIRKLRSKRPDYQEFEANFRTIAFSEKLTKRKPLVQYLLARMMNHYLPNVAIRADQMTIEHLECQTLKAGSAFTDEEVAEIGNLLFVSEKLNNRLKDKSFTEKMSILQKSGVWLDDYLKAQTSWSPSRLRKRSDHLAKLAYEEGWKL